MMPGRAESFGECGPVKCDYQEIKQLPLGVKVEELEAAILVHKIRVSNFTEMAFHFSFLSSQYRVGHTLTLFAPFWFVVCLCSWHLSLILH